MKATAAKDLRIGLGGRIAPHGLIHRRSQGDRGVGGQHQSGQQVVGQPLRQARHQVGGGGGDQHQISPFGQFDVAHSGFGSRVEQFQMHRIAR